jgi:large subunit ribosomal protein L27e
MMQTFIKTVNYNHLMPTRYTLDVDFKNVNNDVVENSTKKVEARKVCAWSRGSLQHAGI